MKMQKGKGDGSHSSKNMIAKNMPKAHSFKGAVKHASAKVGFEHDGHSDDDGHNKPLVMPDQKDIGGFSFGKAKVMKKGY